MFGIEELAQLRRFLIPAFGFLTWELADHYISSLSDEDETKALVVEFPDGTIYVSRGMCLGTKLLGTIKTSARNPRAVLHFPLYRQDLPEGAFYAILVVQGPQQYPNTTLPSRSRLIRAHGRARDCFIAWSHPDGRHLGQRLDCPGIARGQKITLISSLEAIGEFYAREDMFDSDCLSGKGQVTLWLMQYNIFTDGRGRMFLRVILERRIRELPLGSRWYEPLKSGHRKITIPQNALHELARKGFLESCKSYPNMKWRHFFVKELKHATERRVRDFLNSLKPGDFEGNLQRVRRAWQVEKVAQTELYQNGDRRPEPVCHQGNRWVFGHLLDASCLPPKDTSRIEDWADNFTGFRDPYWDPSF